MHHYCTCYGKEHAHVEHPGAMFVQDVHQRPSGRIVFGRNTQGQCDSPRLVQGQQFDAEHKFNRARGDESREIFAGDHD